MILADYQAISRGLGSIAQARDNAEQMALQQAALKRQMERDASDEELRRAAMKIQEQQAAEATADRRERLTADQQRLKMQLDQQTWSFDPRNPANQLHAAQVAHVGAQTAALQSKPQTPLGATTQGIDEFSAAMADAQEENAQALAFAQANPQHPEAGRRVAGASVHQVTAELDHGPILEQAVVPVLEGDTPEQLATGPYNVVIVIEGPRQDRAGRPRRRHPRSARRRRARGDRKSVV